MPAEPTSRKTVEGLRPAWRTAAPGDVPVAIGGNSGSGSACVQRYGSVIPVPTWSSVTGFACATGGRAVPLPGHPAR